MFEYRIQEAWDDYKSDMGLGRVLLFLAFYNLFLFFLSGFSFGGFRFDALYPIFIAFIFYFLRPRIKSLNDTALFFLNSIPAGLCVILNYYLIGEFDRSVGGLARRDPLFSAFDEWIFGGPPSLIFERIANQAGLIGSIIYDIMMLSYMSYFLLPLIGGYLYLRMLPKEDHYKVGRFFFSVVLYFAMNFIFYLLVPVTGPQYWMEDAFTNPLPLTAFGQFLWSLVNDGQTTFIDCFPSGHTGISFLVTIWMYRINHPARYILCITTAFIIGATLAMRYHYTLDLVCAFPLAYFCHRVAWFFIPVDIRSQTLRKDKASANP